MNANRWKNLGATAVLSVAALSPAPASVLINEVRISQPGADTDEYFELVGTPFQSLNRFYYVVIGDGPGGSGVIEEVIDLGGHSLDASGFFVAAEATFSLGPANLITNLQFENNDNVTHLLVEGFFGAVGADLDVNDDCSLDLTPWLVVHDSIALIVEDNPPVTTECHYGPPVVGPDGSFVPGHAYRCVPSGKWTIGVFDPSSASNTDTPAIPNEVCPPILGFGLLHSSLGQASISSDAHSEIHTHEIMLSNIGATGEDGYEIDFDGLRGFHAVLEPSQPLDPQLELISSTMTAASQPLSSLRFAQGTSGLEITPDFPATGTSTYRVQLVRNGKTVGLHEGVSGVGAIVPGFAADRIEFCCHPEFHSYSVTFDPLPIDVPGRGVVIADFMSMEAEGASSEGLAGKVQVTAANTGDVFVTGEWILEFDDQLPLQGLGNARLTQDLGTVVVSGMADSEQDGVRIQFLDFLAPFPNSGGSLEIDLQDGTLSKEESLVCTARADVGSLKNTELCSIGVSRLSGAPDLDVEIEVVLDGLGWDQGVVEMFQDGEFAGRTLVPTGVFGTLTPQSGLLPIEIEELVTTTVGMGPEPQVEFVIHLGDSANLQPFGFVGNELRVRTRDRFDMEALESVDLTSNQEDLRLLDARLIPNTRLPRDYSRKMPAP